MDLFRIMLGVLLALLGIPHSSFGQEVDAELDEAARAAYASGDFVRAAEISTQIYEVRVKAFGPDDLRVVTAALNAGMSLLRSGDSAQAVSFLDIACAGAKQHFGKDHPNVGSCLLDLAAAQARAKRIDQAKETTEEALSLIDAAYPREAYGAALFRAGEVFRSAGDDETALGYFLRCKQVYDALGAGGEIYQASILMEIGQTYHALSRFDEAATFLQSVLDAQRADLEPQNPTTLSTVYLLADCYQNLGKYDQALSLLEELATGLEGVDEGTHLQTEDVLLEIAELQRRSGGIVEALHSCQAVLNRLTDNSSPVARQQRVRALTLSGEIYAEQQLFSDAERVLRDALREAEDEGGDPVSLQVALERLGFYLIRRGRYAEAGARLNQALAITARTSGSDSLSVASLLEKIAVPLLSGNDCERALPYITRAEDIYRRQSPDSVDLVRAIKLSAMCLEDENLRAQAMTEALAIQSTIETEASPGFLIDSAGEYLRRGDLGEAKRLVEEAVALDSSSAVAHDILGSILEAQGTLDKAAAEIEKAIEISASQYGTDSMNVAARQFNLGRILLRADQLDSAQQIFLTAASTFAEHTANLFGSLSLAEQRQLLPQQAAVQISAVLSTCQEDDCLAEGYALVIPWKGLIVSGLRRQATLARVSEEHLISGTSARWRTVRRQLAEWSLARGAFPYDQWKTRNDELAQEKELLERQILSGANLELDLPRVELGALRRSLREGEVFVDIYKYSDFRTGTESESNYGAVLVSKTFGPRFVKLGLAASLELTVNSWLNAVSQESRRPWQSVVSAVWSSLLQSFPPDTRAVRVSPDGDLIKLPWHLFALEANAHQITEITEVSSARALVRSRSGSRPSLQGGPILVVGGVNYDVGRIETSPSPPGTPFKELIWARREAEEVVALARAAGIHFHWLKDAEATKDLVVDEMANARIILFATHAFVNSYGSSEGRGRAFEVGEIRPWSRNALVESGIALSGANVQNNTSLLTEGILTAEEVLDADLSNLDLVVLSACSSGLGAETEGQGMLGLRSTFLAAGARRLVLSLWNVDDEATQILVTAFFRELWRDDSSIVGALQAAQREVRSDPRFRAPKYWAGWTVLDPGQ